MAHTVLTIKHLEHDAHTLDSSSDSGNFIAMLPNVAGTLFKHIGP
jgi:hypothetical protein